MASFVLGIDQGTTGSTAILFDESGKIRAKSYEEFEQIFPKPGWVEHNPQEIWKVTLGVARKAMSDSGVSASEIAAIGITNQRETVVVWDRETGEPIHNAIVWQCRRTTDLCNELRANGSEPDIQRRTGLLLDPYFSATKLNWVLKNVPKAIERAKRGKLAFGTIDSWLLWNLTGGAVHATDFTNASRTMLFDLESKAWSESLCKLFEIPMKLLPEVRPSISDFGATQPDLFGAAIPIRGVAGDQQAALFGHGAVNAGQAKCTFGTGAFAMVFCGTKRIASNHRLLTTLACAADGSPAYAIEGSVFVAGAVMQWLRDGLNLIQNASESEAMARSIPDTGGVYFVPALVGLGAPYWNAEARGLIAGITRGTTRSHLVRAALESMAYQTGDLFDAMERDTGNRLTELKVDGGATQNAFLLEFLAGILNCVVVRPSMIEMTAYGAARLAGISAKIWPVEPPAMDSVRIEPNLPRSQRDSLRRGWRNAVHRAIAPSSN